MKVIVIVVIVFCWFVCLFLDYQSAATKDYGYEERIGNAKKVSTLFNLLFCCFAETENDSIVSHTV